MKFLSSLVERLPGSWKIADGQAFGLGNIAAANLPTCNESRKNEMRYIPGGAGVADRWVVCEKDAADAYAWEDKGDAYFDATYQVAGCVSTPRR